MKTLKNKTRNKLEDLKDYFDMLDGKKVYFKDKQYFINTSFRRNGKGCPSKFYTGADLKIFLSDADKEKPLRFSKNCLLIAKTSSNINSRYSLTKLAEDYIDCLNQYEDVFYNDEVLYG